MAVVAKVDFNSLLPTESLDKLATSAAKIALNNFQWRYTTLLLFNSNLISGVDLFLKLYNKTQIIGKGVFYPSFAEKTKQYILFGVDVPNIEEMLYWMKPHQFDNTGDYIIICQSIISQECDEKKAIRIFWNFKVTNVVFVKQTSAGKVVGYTYFYPDKNCLNSNPVETKICTYNNTCKGIFTKKLINLHLCPITVSTFIQMPYMNITDGKPRGADGDLLILLAERLNTTLKMMTPRIGDGWGKIDQNGSWSGSLRDILDDVANFSMTSAAVTRSRFSYFQISVGYYASTVAWVTHPAQVKPASLKLFHPFETLSQIVLAITFIIVGFCAWFVNSKFWPFQYHKVNKSQSEDGVLFYTWMLCMGVPSTKLPAKSAFLYMTLFWIWYCYLIRTLYQVYLISSLQGNFYYSVLNTIEEAFYENYSFGGGLALKDYYIDSPLVYNNWKEVQTQDIIPTLTNLTNKKFVLAMNLETAKTVIKKKKLFVHVLPQKVINSPTVIFFKKFSPLARSVNTILRRLTESGFTEKIYKNYASKSGLRDENSREPITLQHYTGCYYILLVGWLVSAALFSMEIIYGKLTK